jgi:hypothetical protein
MIFHASKETALVDTKKIAGLGTIATLKIGENASMRESL